MSAVGYVKAVKPRSCGSGIRYSEVVARTTIAVREVSNSVEQVKADIRACSRRLGSCSDMSRRSLTTRCRVPGHQRRMG